MGTVFHAWIFLWKDKVRPNIWPKIPEDLSLWRKLGCQILLKALVNLSNTTVRRSAVDQENLKSYWKQKKPHTFLYLINNPIIYKFFKDCTNHRKMKRAVIFSSRPFPNILKQRDWWDLPTIWKTWLLQTHWKVELVCMKVQAHSSSEPPLEYNQDQMPFTNQGSLWPF